MNQSNPHIEIQRGIEEGVFHRATANAVVALLNGWELTENDLSYIVLALREAVRIEYHARHYHTPALPRARIKRLIKILRKLGYANSRLKP
jgi:hypothetical protein